MLAEQHENQPLPATVESPSYRKPPGRPFKKGQSGNPSGKAKTPPNVRALAALYTEKSVETLAKAMMAPRAPWPTRVRAAEILLDRGHGRSPIMVDPEAANQVGASFAALLDAIANQSQVEQPPMINVTPEPSDG